MIRKIAGHLKRFFTGNKVAQDALGIRPIGTVNKPAKSNGKHPLHKYHFGNFAPMKLKLKMK